MQNTSISEIIRAHPEITTFFNKKNIDYCCGGKDMIGDAAKEQGYDVDRFLQEMDEFLAKVEHQKVKAIDEEVFRYTVPQMIRHLQSVHHEPERQRLFEVDRLINTILIAHFENHGEELLTLHRLFSALKVELEAHFVKEDKVVFPKILHAFESESMTSEVLKEVRELEDEHEEAGEIIKKILGVTDNFRVPEDGCPTFRATYENLRLLTESIFLHIFKENSVLFPALEKDAKA
ncbi:MAG TPA: hypothetical protein DIC53_02980 [Synergistaceae bacterium]|jgi:regulator of cell morphogenesis and NO signaling|nr:hypothetical protein [Synergistaceae bacterium]